MRLKYQQTSEVLFFLLLTHAYRTCNFIDISFLPFEFIFVFPMDPYFKLKGNYHYVAGPAYWFLPLLYIIRVFWMQHSWSLLNQFPYARAPTLCQLWGCPMQANAPVQKLCWRSWWKLRPSSLVQSAMEGIAMQSKRKTWRSCWAATSSGSPRWRLRSRSPFYSILIIIMNKSWTLRLWTVMTDLCFPLSSSTCNGCNLDKSYVDANCGIGGCCEPKLVIIWQCLELSV